MAKPQPSAYERLLDQIDRFVRHYGLLKEWQAWPADPSALPDPPERRARERRGGPDRREVDRRREDRRSTDRRRGRRASD
ncbi:MAG: hypothetical protein HY703_01120 [Gemmatimonadetes bacterium]|nr:hypothetical protein [Gemmatimonadota bacterium]